MKPSQLQLKSYFFTKVSVEVNGKFVTDPDYSKSGNIPEINLEFAQKKKTPYEWQVKLHVRSSQKDEETTPYLYDIIVIGFFEVDKDVSEKQMMRLIAINAPALLYGPTREQLENISSRGPLPSRHLPSVTFIDTALTKLSPAKLKIKRQNKKIKAKVKRKKS